MKILFINDSSDSPNWGSRASSFAMKKMISNTGNCDIVPIYQDTIYGLRNSDDPIKKINNKLKLLVPPIAVELYRYISGQLFFLEKTPSSWDGFEKSLQKVLKGKSYSSEIQAIKDVDIVLINGEGGFYRNDQLSRELLFLGYLSKKICDKPTVLVNHTGDFSHPELHKIARNVYPLFDDVVFRDPISARKCKEFCDGKIGGDSTFIFEPMPLSDWIPVVNREKYFDFWPNKAHFDPSKPYLCIGGSSNLASVKGDRYDPIAKFSFLIDQILKHFPYQVILTASDIRDLKVFEPLSKQYKLPLLGLSVPIQQVIDILGHAKAYIGGRWHPSIFTLIGGNPIIPLSAKTFKMESLIEIFDLPKRIFKPQNFENDIHAIIRLLDEHISQGDSLSKELKKRAQQERNKAFRNVSFLEKKDTLFRGLN